MIRKIKLVNWRSHENTELEFHRGINVIMGRMGAGKSSITDAMCFALFATFPNLQKKTIKLDDIIMRTPKEKRTASVELWFDIGGHEYYVKRVIEKKKGTTTSELRMDGKLVEAPKSNAVTKAVESTLGLDYDLFTRAVYSEQNNIDYFLSLRPTDRKKKIDELLMIDRFEKMRATTVSLISKARERANERLRDINSMNEEKAKKDVAEISSRIERLEGEVSNSMKELTENEKNIALISKDISEMKSMKERLDALMREISSKKGETESLKFEMERLKKFYEMRNELEKELRALPNVSELESELAKVKSEINETVERMKHIESELGRVEYLIASNERKRKERAVYENEIKKYVNKYASIENLEKMIADETNEIQELKSKLGEEIGKKNELIASLDQLKKSDKKCPVCGSPLTEEKIKALKSEKESAIQDVEKSIVEIERNIEDKKASIEKMNRDINVWRKLTTKLGMLKEESVEDASALKSEKLEAQSKYDELSKLEKELNEKINKVRAESMEIQKKLEHANEYEEKSKRLSKLSDEISEFESRKYEIEKNLDMEKLEQLENELRHLYAKSSEISTSIEKNKQLINELNSFKSELESKISLIEKYKREYKILSKMEEELREFEKALVKTQEQIRKKIIEAVNRNMSAVWKEFYPYDEIQDIRLNATENDYKLELFDGAEWRGVDGVASGGERTSAAISLRIALSISLVKQLKWLILDEPTHNLDDAAIDSFSFILREKLSSLVNQIFIITHEEKLENAVTGSFYKLSKEGGVTKAELKME